MTVSGGYVGPNPPVPVGAAPTALLARVAALEADNARLRDALGVAEKPDLVADVGLIVDRVMSGVAVITEDRAWLEGLLRRAATEGYLAGASELLERAERAEASLAVAGGQAERAIRETRPLRQIALAAKALTACWFVSDDDCSECFAALRAAVAGWGDATADTEPEE